MDGYIPFGRGAYANRRFGLPMVELVNWMAEAAPEDDTTQTRLIPTPGLVEFATGFEGGASGVYQSDTVYFGRAIVATYGNAYRVDSDGTVVQLAPVEGDLTTPVSLPTDGLAAQYAVSQTPELIVNLGGRVFEITTNNIVEFTDSHPATNPITSVAEIAQRHLYGEKLTGRVWFSEVTDAQNVQGDSFFTAEQDPDQLIGLWVNGQDIWVMGDKSLELWYATGDQDAPFAWRNVEVQKGLIGGRAVTTSDSAMHLVGKDRMVYRMNGYSPQRISTHPIEELLEAETDLDGIRLSSYEQSGHSLLGLHLPLGGDWFFDSATELWHQRKSNGKVNSNFCYPVRSFNKMLFLGDASGTTKMFEARLDTFTDDGLNVVRTATAVARIRDGRQRVSRIAIDATSGTAPVTGQGSCPLAMFSWAPDGKNYKNVIEREMGPRGDHGYRTIFGPIGVVEGPHPTMKLSISDPIGIALMGGIINPERP